MCWPKASATLSMVSFVTVVVGSVGLREPFLSGKLSLLSSRASGGSWMLWLVASESEKALSCGSRNSVPIPGKPQLPQPPQARREAWEHIVPVASGTTWQRTPLDQPPNSFRNRQCWGNSLQGTRGDSDLGYPLCASSDHHPRSCFLVNIDLF